MLGRGIRRSGVSIVIALLMSVPITPAAGGTMPSKVARGVATVSYSFRSNAWSNGGFKWSFSGYRFGSTLAFYVVAVRQSGVRNHPKEEYEWYSGLPGSDAMFAPDLTSASVGTGAALGDYGSVDMSLEAPSRLRKTVKRCRKTGAVLERDRKRTGTFSGTFSFIPNETGLPTNVTRSAVTVTLAKRATTGTSCPAGPCSPGSRFDGSHHAGGAWSFVEANRWGGGAFLRVGTRREDTANAVTIFSSIYATVPANAVMIESAGVTLRGGALMPFASGVVRLTRVSSRTHDAKHCRTVHVTEHYDSGKIVGRFATGAVTFNSFGSALATIWRRI
jgi:hypothetical protein